MYPIPLDNPEAALRTLIGNTSPISIHGINRMPDGKFRTFSVTKNESQRKTDKTNKIYD